MRLATLRNDDRDGCLVVVDRGLVRAVAVSDIAPTLQYALDHWPEVAPALADLSARLDEGDLPHTIRFDPADARAPLPRAYQFLDGSAYLAH